MTHGDIITKFLIEYDKMTTTSSYPSLTEYEIQTVLDKAYITIIANKLTGNNPRKALFESDGKAIDDIRPLIVTQSTERSKTQPSNIASNEIVYNTPTEPKWMYYAQSMLEVKNTIIPVQLVSHQDSQNFKNSDINMPWMTNPVVYIEGTDESLHVLYDSLKYEDSDIHDLICTYIKRPAKFVDNSNETPFELNDNVAEEVINMAIIMSAEIVESQRLNTKSSLNSVES